MAALRNTAINVSRLAGHTTIAAARRHYSWEPGTALLTIIASMTNTHRRRSRPSLTLHFPCCRPGAQGALTLRYRTAPSRKGSAVLLQWIRCDGPVDGSRAGMPPVDRQSLWLNASRTAAAPVAATLRPK